MIDLEKWLKTEVTRIIQRFEKCLVDIERLRVEVQAIQASQAALNKLIVDERIARMNEKVYERIARAEERLSEIYIKTLK